MVDFLAIGRHMPRKRYSEGTLDIIGTGKNRRWRGYWFVYVLVDGREVRRKREKVFGLATKPKHEARAELARAIAESRGELPPPPENPTIGQLWERYCLHKSGVWSKAMSDIMVSLFKTSVLPTLENIPLAEVTIAPLQDVLNRLAAAGRSESALQKARTHMKAMLEFAVDERLLNINPARGKKLVCPKKGVPKPSKRFLALDEAHALLRVAEGRDRLILRLLLVAGVRSQELVLLRANDIESGQIRVDEAFKSRESGDKRIGLTKTDDVQGVPEVVAIPTALENELREWVRSKGIAPDGLLFQNALGGPIDPHNYLERTLQPLAVRAGVGLRRTGKVLEDGSPEITSDVTYQALRRTCATYFRGNLKGAQQQLRHATPTVTAKYYQQSITSEHRAAVEKLDQELCQPKVVALKKRA